MAPWTKDEDGLYGCVTELQYFSSVRLSNSDIGLFKRSPYSLLFKNKNGSALHSNSMQLGSVVHCLYLEPDNFNKIYGVIPEDIDRRTKQGKQDWASWEAKNKDKFALRTSVYVEAMNIVARLSDYMGSASDLMGAGHAEVSAFFQLEGVACRARLDYLSHDGIIWDLKTTRDISDFHNSFARYGYHRQAAFYLLALKMLNEPVKGFKTIVVETSEPFESAVFEYDRDALLVGKQEIDLAIDQYKKCVDSDKWPMRYQELEKLSLPGWYL
jgi:exodeoxyribonuclease VIII